LAAAVKELRAKLPIKVEAISGPQGKGQSSGSDSVSMPIPYEKATTFAQYTPATQTEIEDAIKNALAVKEAWMNTPFTDRAAVFLRAAELISTKYRFEIMAATMMGQGKNAWQAEIDAAAELADFFRYNVGFAVSFHVLCSGVAH